MTYACYMCLIHFCQIVEYVKYSPVTMFSMDKFFKMCLICCDACKCETGLELYWTNKSGNGDSKFIWNQLWCLKKRQEERPSITTFTKKFTVLDVGKMSWPAWPYCKLPLHHISICKYKKISWESDSYKNSELEFEETWAIFNLCNTLFL